MNLDERKKIVDNLIDVFFKAGETSLELRNKGLNKETKSDNTPVTNADIKVNNILTNKIKEITPQIPIVSEESSANKEAKNLKTFWLIDPIDGTSDYIQGRDEFTLNAGLIIENKAELGIINAPAKKRLFYSYGLGSCFELNENKKITLNCKKLNNDGEVNAVTYSNNLKPEIIELHKKYKVTNYKKMKSSLKFCVIATGEFDLYIADARASEWDIAAGHAILKNAGGKVSDFNGNEILYGKKDFKNPALILKRTTDL